MFFLFNARQPRSAARRGCARGSSEGRWLRSLPPSDVALQELYLEFLDLARAAGLDAEAFRTRHAVLECESVSLDDFLAGRRADAAVQTDDEVPAPPSLPADDGSWDSDSQVGLCRAVRPFVDGGQSLSLIHI